MQIELGQESELLARVFEGLGVSSEGSHILGALTLARQQAELLGLDGRARGVGTFISVEGYLQGAVQLACARCLEAFSLPVREKFRFFLQSSSGTSGESDEEIELNPEDLDLSFLEGDRVDVQGLLQEQLVLALPSQPLCRDDCRGICQACGADLNHEPCV